MAGYTRQSVADIIANAVIKAAPVNAEYNAIRDAFNASTGHKHDGTSAEGAYVPTISDTDNYNKVVIDATNNRISFYNEVSSAAVEQIRLEDGVLKPVTDDDVDLGATGAEFKDLYIDGIGYIDSVVITGGTIDDTVIGSTTAAAGTFTDLTSTGTSTHATVDINGGAIDATTIGATTPAAGDFTDVGLTGNLTVTGTSALTGTTTITSADINSGAMDNTTIGNTTPAAGTFTTVNSSGAMIATGGFQGTLTGAVIGDVTGDLTGNVTGNVTGNLDGIIGSSTPAAGSFTTVSTSGQATLATVDINGGSIDGTIIGASTAAAITGTTITGTSLVGPVTGNITGNVTGNVTGNLTGNVTGNVTAASGTSSFTDVTINGTLNMNAGTTATITNLTAPSNDLDAATKKYVDDEVAALVDSAPGTLDTLNELAAALGDDADFANTVTTSIATKLPLAGGTMTGAIAMGTSKITGLGDPTAAQDAVSKNYADTRFLALTGGTMTGSINMGSSPITTTHTPTNAADLTTKTYVDGILGSATAAATSATNAATSETNAATSETNAANSATAAATSATNAAASYDDFDDRYLGAKTSAPTLDNDGDALVLGALYFNTTTDTMQVYGSSGWTAAGSSVNGTTDRNTYTATSGQTTFAATYDAGYVDVYLNGVKLLLGTDFTATSGTSIVLTTGATAGDIVDIVAYGTFVLADHLTETQSDARYLLESNNLSDLDDAATARTNLGVAIGTDVQAYDATIVVDADIGVTVQGYDVNTAKYDDTTANFTGTLQNGGSNVVVDSDIGSTVQAYNANLAGINQGLATTDSPNFTALNVNGTVTADGLTVSSSGTSNSLTLTKTDGNAVKLVAGNTEGTHTFEFNNGGVYLSDTTGLRLGLSSDGDISFYEDTGTTAKFFWDASAESLGIGTTSPSTALDVNGTVNATAFTGDGSGLTGVGFTTNVTTTNTTASKDNHYYLNAAGITLTLPASPSVGDEVRISEVGGNTDNVIGRNGSNIMGTADDITLDTAYTVIYLRYVDATIGWAFS